MSTNGAVALRNKKSLHQGKLQLLCVAGWFILVSVPIIGLLARHLSPIRADQVRGSEAVIRQWRLNHVLVDGCPCSASIADYLIARGPLNDAAERVLVAAGNRECKWFGSLRDRGFCVEYMSASDIHRITGAQGGPWLVISDPTGATRYCGGYIDGRPGDPSASDKKPADVAILAAVRRGVVVQPLVGFGCSVGNSLFDQWTP